MVTVPTSFIFAHERVGDWTESGLLEPFELDTDGDEFFRCDITSLRYQNELMGLPLAFKSLALFYNKNVISSAPETTDGIHSSLTVTSRRRVSASLSGR